MSRTRRFDHAIVVASCVVWSALMGSSQARADGGTRAIRLVYDAPASCPDAKAFESGLRVRSAKIAVSSEARNEVRVRISARAERFEGEVTLVESGTGDTTRHVSGTCPDVVAALSLIAAVALDPMASTAPLPGKATTSTPAVALDTATQTPAPKVEPASPPPPPVTPGSQTASERARDEGEPPGTSSRHGWRWSVGAGVGFTGGVTPSLAVSVPVFVDVARSTSSLAAPAFRLRFERTSVDSDAAHFTWTAGSFDACPIALSTRTLHVWPCARARAGVLDGEGEATPSRTASRPWVTVGAIARVREVLVGSLFVELEGGGEAPLVRDRFFLEPGETVHRAPVGLAVGAFNLGASFW